LSVLLVRRGPLQNITTLLRYGVGVWIILFCSPLAWCEEVRIVPPRLRWKVGDGWHIRLTYDPRSSGDSVETSRVISYEMHVLVTGGRKSGRSDCWQLEFVPLKDLPQVGGPYRVLVNKDTGQVEKVQSRKTLADVKLSPSRELAQPMGTLPGIPVEVLPLLRWDSPMKQDGKSTIHLGAQVMGDGTWLQAIFKENGEERLQVRQRWFPGDSWWKEYEFWRDGRKELTASRIVERQVPVISEKQTPVPTTPAVPPTLAPASSDSPLQPTDTGLPLAAWLTRHPPGSDVDAEGLRDDPRLRVPLTGMMKSPTVTELLSRLQDITHLTMTCEPTAPSPEPVFGNPHFYQTPAYVVMQQMAKSRRGKGHWQSTVDGYRLLLDDPTVAETPPTPVRPWPIRLWLRFGSLGGFILVTGGLLWWRLRRPRNPLQSAESEIPSTTR
jgi:hypothetical protein